YPDVLGGIAPESNSGVLETKGWEAILGWNDNIGDLRYNISANMSDNRNELMKYEGTSLSIPGLNRVSANPLEGYPINSYFLYETDGFFQDQTEVDAYYEQYTQNGQGIIPARDGDADPNVVAVSELRPGDTRKVDSNGDG